MTLHPFSSRHKICRAMLGRHARRFLPRLLGMSSVYLMIVLGYAVFFSGLVDIVPRSQEDGLIETIGAAGFLAASMLCFLTYGTVSKHRNRTLSPERTGKLFYVSFGILFFIGFGEEISWGQRIFGWRTSELFYRWNLQGETNIHNLWLFHASHLDGRNKSFVEMMLNMSRLFTIFCFSYGLLIPLLNKLSIRAHRLLKRIQLPFPPLWIGFLFVVNYAVFHGVVVVLPAYNSHFNELKEAIYALIFVLSSAHGLRKQCVLHEARPPVGHGSAAVLYPPAHNVERL